MEAQHSPKRSQSNSSSSSSRIHVKAAKHKGDAMNQDPPITLSGQVSDEESSQDDATDDEALGEEMSQEANPSTQEGNIDDRGLDPTRIAPSQKESADCNPNGSPSNKTLTDPSTHEPKETGSESPVVFSNGNWQAIYNTQSNAYYFANSKTGEITWTNPMVSAAAALKPSILPQPPNLGGINPELAHLDPQTARMMSGSASLHYAPTFSAHFNLKTGRFEGDPNHDPSRVSEYVRARTQAGAYFDVEGWEKSLKRHNGRIAGTSRETREEAINQGKRMSKAEVNQFKEKKLEKKARKQRAWLVGSK